MARNASAKRRSSKGARADDIHDNVSVLPIPTRLDKGVGKTKKFQTRGPAQAQYLQLIESKTIIIGEGPAGTGKSMVAAMHAAKLLDEKRIGQILITRPAVEAEEKLGFLPGTKEEKVAPYFEPIMKFFRQYFGDTAAEYYVNKKIIEFKPLAYLRGLTFENAFVLLDEAQNTTPKQMKLFLSRIGEYCTVVLDGDTDQIDIKGKSGLTHAIKVLDGMADVGYMRFTDDDIVRSPLVKEIMKRYRTNPVDA